MKVLIVGANGQLGWELRQTASEDCRIFAYGSEKLDIRDSVAVQETVSTDMPRVIINAAAYTAVDKAEEEPDQAFAVNSQGAANLADAAQRIGSRLIQISTDFIFDGKKTQPYLPDDVPNPIGVYGASKLEGERKVAAVLGSDALILRTAWVYSSHGRNFVKTMLRLMRERDQLGVVADQVGTPTWARGLAEVVWKFAARPQNGIYHWTDAGIASWYDFAVAIQEEAVNIGLPAGNVSINPVTTAEYPTPAARPSYSVLDKTGTWQVLGTNAPHWRVNLRKMLQELRDGENE